MLVKLTVAAGILGAATIVGAQAPGQQPPADRPTTQPATETNKVQPAAEANKVTISGCVKPGASANSFILSNAAITPTMPGREAAPTTGTAGSTKSYNVVAKSGEELSKHLNHKVEVTGTLSASRPPSASAPAPATAAADQPAETVTVQTFKMVAMACP
jgi:hypothetical protein